jgi:transcriptional regulator with XRE-family HTH domain
VEQEKLVGMRTEQVQQHLHPASLAREILAVNLIRLRAQRGWSQEALAFETGLHRTFVAHVERRARNISLDNVERLANAFGLETFELLTPMKRRSSAAAEAKDGVQNSFAGSQ